MPVTTIQIDKKTLKVLQKLKEAHGMKSYEEAIHLLLRKSMKPQKSMFGYLGKQSMKQILRGLRDEGERI
ncbi:MAG: hypothetical protein DRN21_03590 [Thermoplasmata archaeon]|nr:MAG: hypothetical protein DRN07_01345 [Thermoplasmata archaeon]RLF39419.1 MAG: hypothetical protein DRN21_03590 [Thermoplasmata archaeon]